MDKFSAELLEQHTVRLLNAKDSYGTFCQLHEEITKDRPSLQRQLCQSFKERASKPAKKLYYYFLTFTLDPRLAERVGGFSEAFYERVHRYITKLIQNKQWCTEYISLVREGGDDVDKHTHWHAYIVTTKYFDSASKLGHYKKLYGNYKLCVSKKNFVPHAYHYMEKQNSQKILKHGLCGFDEDFLTQIHNSQMSQTIGEDCMIEWYNSLEKTKGGGVS